tara:strand:- start:627 stop:1205 length:579 start_codon:yes stop_codon:yes gene_type:complete
MKLFFLRHTSLDVGFDIFYGQTDVDVSDTFEEEVKNIKKKLELNNVDLEKLRVISSPLKRCKKLTERITGNHETDDRIKEMNLGDWEMKKMSSIPKEDKINWENNILSFKIPNGESNKEFLNRLKNFLDDIIKIGQDVFLVCHAGSINGMISILTGEPFDKLVKNYWEKISYGSLSLIEVKKGKVFKKRIGI